MKRLSWAIIEFIAGTILCGLAIWFQDLVMAILGFMCMIIATNQYYDDKLEELSDMYQDLLDLFNDLKKEEKEND